MRVNDWAVAHLSLFRSQEPDCLVPIGRSCRKSDDFHTRESSRICADCWVFARALVVDHQNYQVCVDAPLKLCFVSSEDISVRPGFALVGGGRSHSMWDLLQKAWFVLLPWRNVACILLCWLSWTIVYIISNAAQCRILGLNLQIQLDTMDHSPDDIGTCLTSLGPGLFPIRRYFISSTECSATNGVNQSRLSTDNRPSLRYCLLLFGPYDIWKVLDRLPG